MRRFVTKLSSTMIAMAFITMLNPSVFAADGDVEELQAKLDEAKELLAQDKANHDETAEKKRLIDERLAAGKQRESEIFEEMKQLCEEQDKLKPGSLDSCMAKLNN